MVKNKTVKEHKDDIEKLINMGKPNNKWLNIVVSFLVVIGMLLFVIWAFMVCWNDVIPYLFGLKTIGFTQSMALIVIISTILPGKLVKK